MTEDLILKLLGLVLLLVLSAFFSGSEAALFSLGKARRRQLEEDPSLTAKTLSHLLRRSHDLLVTLLVGITLANIGASALATAIAERLVGRHGLSLAIAGMIFLIPVFGEVLPMTLAIERSLPWSRLAALPITWLSALFLPIRKVLGGFTILAARLVAPETIDGAQGLTEAELRTLVDVGAKEGVVERSEREMIHKVFSFGDTLVKRVMVPCPDMFCLELRTPPAEILRALREHLHSRVPVYHGSIDNIIGILYTKDLLPYYRGLPDGFDLQTLLRPPHFVPETKRADALLEEFQARRIHMAIVVDEYGGTAGLVALEDLLEELVGEISDEFDVEERLYRTMDPTTYRISGKMPIDQFNRLLNLSVHTEGFDTVGGYILDLFGRIPHKGEVMETDNVKITVERVHRTRVLEVLVALKTNAPPPQKEA